MKELLANKKLLAIAGAVVIALIIGGVFLLSNKTGGDPSAVTSETDLDETAPITAEELGLETTLRDDGKALKFAISNTDGIDYVEYQITYTKEIEGEEVPEGLFGEIEPEDGVIETEYREFGTCSSGRCRYDDVVSDIKLILKITKDGKLYSAEETIPLPTTEG